MARRSMLTSGSRLVRGLVVAAAFTFLMGFAHDNGILDQFVTAAKESWKAEAAEKDSRLDGLTNPGGGATPAPAQPAPAAASPEEKAAAQKALTSLGTIPVKGKAPMTGYDREQFGQEWDDAVGDWPRWSRDGIDSRNDALSRDLTNKECKAGTVSKKSGACKVLSGDFDEPYSGKPFHFIAGDSRMEHSLDIDHVVALGNVWVSGAWRWEPGKRALIANDPLNLWSVDASLNRQKSDADAATWLPPNKSARCRYISSQVQVKTKYGLSVTRAEKDAMTRVLNGCVA